MLPLDFQILAEKITDLFPTESKHTYYIPRVPGNKRVKPINPKGKLIDKYRNLCRTYYLTKNDVSAADSINEYQICQTDDNGKRTHYTEYLIIGLFVQGVWQVADCWFSGDK